MAFRISGHLVGGNTPVVRNMQIGETLYTGQLLESGRVGGASGHVQIADAASEAHEDDQPIVGVALGVHNTEDAGWNSTNYGDTATVDTGQAAQLLNDPKGACEVEVGLIIPSITLVSAPIYNAAYGTALSEVTVSTASTTGLAVTHAATAVTDIADDLGTVYCRSGANRGHYRVISTGTTTAQTVTIAFPYDTTTSCIFVVASCVLGIGGLDIPATANCIDGNNDLDKYYDVFYHSLDLETSGGEQASLTFHPHACALGT